LTARIMAPEELLPIGYQVCEKAAGRYRKTGSEYPREAYEKKVQAAAVVDGVLEFFGVFSGDQLVGYSENYVQHNAVFCESIWYDPEFLGKYSSYVLIDAMLDYYLNEKKLAYVSDGWRSIYHETGIQDHLVKVFGFRKEYAVIQIAYAPSFAAAIRCAFPLRKAIWTLSRKSQNRTLAKIAAILTQEDIARGCKKLALDHPHPNN